jgi:hypothetical protein
MLWRFNAARWIREISRRLCLRQVTFGNILFYQVPHRASDSFFLWYDQESVLIFWRQRLEPFLRHSLSWNSFLQYIIEFDSKHRVCIIFITDVSDTKQWKVCERVHMRHLCLLYTTFFSFVCAPINISNYVMFEIDYLWLMTPVYILPELVLANAFVCIDLSVFINCGLPKTHISFKFSFR